MVARGRRTKGKVAWQSGALAFGLLGAFFWFLQPVKAQLPTVDDQWLFREKFPEITVRVGCDFPDAVAPETFSLSEDGVPQSLVAATSLTVRPRTQTAIFIDLFAGQKGKAEEVSLALRTLHALYQTNLFTIATDQLAVYAPVNGHTPTTTAAPTAALTVTHAPTTTLDVVVDWTGDAGLVVNSVVTITAGTQERPFAALEKTALMRLLLETLNRFEPHSLRRQNLLLFSDGTDAISKELLPEVVALAKSRQITIHTFYLQTGYNGSANLEDLARQTGGQFMPLSKALAWDKAAWDAFWSQLIAPRRLCDLTYRTSQTQPHWLLVRSVITTTPALQPIALTVPTVTVNPPVVRILSPQINQQLTAPVALDGSVMAAVSLPLAVAWEFTEAPSRTIKTVTYEINGLTAVTPRTLPAPTGAPTLLQESVPLTPVLAGAYVVHVKVVDELGLVGEANVPFTVRVLPPPPLPTPTSTPTVTPTPTRLPTWTPTPMPTATLRWEQKAVATTVAAVEGGGTATRNWFDADRPYRALLVGSTLFFVGLLAGLWYWWQKRLAKLQVAPIAMKEPPSKVYAILYRLRTEPGLLLQQVVKLEDKDVRLPQKLYTRLGQSEQTGQSADDSLSVFQWQITYHDKHYTLEPGDPNKKKRNVMVRRGNDHSEVAKRFNLQNNDEIRLGQTWYAFYELQTSSVPEPEAQARNQPPAPPAQPPSGD